MMWCIYEAMRILERRHLKDSQIIALIRDASKGRLLIRYAATIPSDLRTLRGLLYQPRIGDTMKGDDTDDITLATGEAIKAICTVNGHGPPRLDGDMTTAPCTWVDEELAQHVRDKVIFLTVDAASNEMSSGQQMQRTLLPNLRFIIRDKMHESRRLLTRLFKSDPFIDEVYNHIVRGGYVNEQPVAAGLDEIASERGKVVLRGKSIIRVIEASEQFKSWWAQNVRISQDCQEANIKPVIKNLRSAPHRVESMQKPAARAVLYCDALLATANQIFEMRRGTYESRIAMEFLKFVSGQQGLERYLQLAMTADGSDEAIILTRFLENFDASEMSHQLSKFMVHIRHLFDDFGCIHNGYTHFFLETVCRNERIFLLDDGASLRCATETRPKRDPPQT